MATTVIAARFWSCVERRGPDECWPWRAGTNGRGYGQQRIGTERIGAHRLAYELLVGPIPDGLTIDHLCNNPRCCNAIAHMEPVTRAENSRRAGERRRRAAGLPDIRPHGTKQRYWSGCRCGECREANNAACAVRRSTGVVPVGGTHGASGYTNYGCRCEVCRAAHASRMRRQTRQRQALAA